MEHYLLCYLLSRLISWVWFVADWQRLWFLLYMFGLKVNLFDTYICLSFWSILCSTFWPSCRSLSSIFSFLAGNKFKLLGLILGQNVSSSFILFSFSVFLSSSLFITLVLPRLMIFKKVSEISFTITSAIYYGYIIIIIRLSYTLILYLVRKLSPWKVQ